MAGRPEAPRRGAGLGCRPLVLPRHQRVELLGAVSSDGPRAQAGSQGCTEDVGLAAFLRSGQAPTQWTGGGFQWDAPASGKHSFFLPDPKVDTEIPKPVESQDTSLIAPVPTDPRGSLPASPSAPPPPG